MGSVGRSRLEINIRRLLSKCELMAKDSPVGSEDWRLEKFLITLEEMILELQKTPNKPSKDTIATYVRQVEFLKGLLETNNIPSTVEKAVATQLLSPVPESLTKEIHQKTTTKYTKDLRDQLFGEKGDLRQRKGSSSGDDLDALLKYHHNMQEKIAEDMLVMARSMKEQSMLAGNIIRKDTEIVEKSSNLAEKNFSHLHLESEKLQEHSRKAWKCWMWLMLAAVLFIFISFINDANEFQIIPIVVDGNCLFRAISFCFYGTQNFYKDVRVAAVKNVIQKWSFYDNFLEGMNRTENEKLKEQDDMVMFMKIMKKKK